MFANIFIPISSFIRACGDTEILSAKFLTETGNLICRGLSESSSWLSASGLTPCFACSFKTSSFASISSLTLPACGCSFAPEDSAASTADFFIGFSCKTSGASISFLPVFVFGPFTFLKTVTFLAPGFLSLTAVAFFATLAFTVFFLAGLIGPVFFTLGFSLSAARDFLILSTSIDGLLLEMALRTLSTDSSVNIACADLAVTPILTICIRSTFAGMPSFFARSDIFKTSPYPISSFADASIFSAVFLPTPLTSVNASMVDLAISSIVL